MTTVIFDISMSLDGFVTASGVRPAEPLALSETNPRYFTVAVGDATDRRAVYLTGSHVDNNFHDGSCPGADCSETPERNDFRGYLEFLEERLQVAVYRDGELVVDAV
jgi:hypothetical protein